MSPSFSSLYVSNNLSAIVIYNGFVREVLRIYKKECSAIEALY